MISRRVYPALPHKFQRRCVAVRTVEGKSGGHVEQDSCSPPLHHARADADEGDLSPEDLRRGTDQEKRIGQLPGFKWETGLHSSHSWHYNDVMTTHPPRRPEYVDRLPEELEHD